MRSSKSTLRARLISSPRKTARTWPLTTFLTFAAIAATWMLVYFLFLAKLEHTASRRLQQQKINDQNIAVEERSVVDINTPVDNLITFQACQGFANQRLCILYGVLIAINLKRTLVLPRLLTEGSGSEEGIGDKMIRFSEVYDLERISLLLQEHGIQVWEVEDLPNVQFHQAECSDKDLSLCMQDLSKTLGSNNVPIDFGCTFPTHLIHPNNVLENEDLIKAVFENLVPVLKYEKLIQSLIEGIIKDEKDDKFTFVHLRAEKDWIEHCQNWESMNDGMVRNNCMNNTEVLGQQLVLKKVDGQLPIYISIVKQDADERLLSRVIQNLNLNGYKKLYMKEDVTNDVELLSLPSEMAALVDYFVALEADKFVGNSVSTHSALLLLERQLQSKWASYYNLGTIPMGWFLPMYKLPWIIYSQCNGYDSFKHTTLPALQSAILYGNVDAYLYCMNPMEKRAAEALKDLDVKIIERNRVKDILKNADAVSDISHLSALVTLEEFAQHNYVIMSGPKIFVHKRISLNQFYLPLPDEIAKYILPDSVFTGLMIVNQGYIRKGYAQYGNSFVDSIQVNGKNLRKDEKLINGIQFMSQKSPQPYIVTYNQVTVSDLEVYLVGGICPLKQKISCLDILQNSCQSIMDFLVISTQPELHPQLLHYCNRQISYSRF
eukprot:TRINITY_DN191_c0_g1_i1.p1 TRINITY_DN191_c0_g1~~TRINITY_DN191_c0_g1_i1.p1  ORF type:complete len:670 (+),score=70.77 TRINITY_DN191_c0_g1_i1:26-2011(+)